jgi:hypothetical protein
MEWFAGTFYVALSRVTSLDNVSFINFRGKFKALQRSLDFYTQGYVINEPSSTCESSHLECLLQNKAYFYIFCGNTIEHSNNDLCKYISKTLMSLDENVSNDDFSAKMEDFSAKIEDFSTGEWEKDVEKLLHPVLNFLQQTYENEIVCDDNSRKRKHNLLHVELKNFLENAKKIKK